MAEWLKAHAWKACLLERVTWVRIPLSPPYSLECREIQSHCPENRGKSPQFCNSDPQTGPEKVSCSMLQAGFAAFFSGGQTSSPVSTTPLGECNAIQTDDKAKGLGFCPLSETPFGASHKPVSGQLQVGRRSARHGPLTFPQALCDCNNIYIMMNSMQPFVHSQGSILDCGKSNGSLDIRLRWINDLRA
jgi:hypothetical protein